ncbi:MAG: aminotransferase class I/II-fold pyridoxal phosphate-dependent enzyme [Faecalibacterium prausnitzii]
MAVPAWRGSCLCSNTALLEKMQTAGQPWAVSSLAQAAAGGAGRNCLCRPGADTLLRSSVLLLRDGLRALGLRVLDGSANYLLFHAPETLGDALQQRGISAAQLRQLPWLDGSWYRTAVRTAPENQQLIEALREVLA